MIPTSQPANDPAVATTLVHCRAALEGHYGRRLEGLVLYGSTARGTAGKESDLHLLVLLRGDFDFFAELRAVTAILYPVQLESDRLISARPASIVDFEAETWHGKGCECDRGKEGCPKQRPFEPSKQPSGLL